MEKQINNTVKTLIYGYVAYWLLSLVLFIIGECDDYFTGIMAENFKQTYIFETITILLTAAFIPASLKLFSVVLQKRINNISIDRALKEYALWSSVRLMMLLAVTLCGIFCYFLTLSSTGGLCALMGITASLFCIPSELKMRRDLHIEKVE